MKTPTEYYFDGYRNQQVNCRATVGNFLRGQIGSNCSLCVEWFYAMIMSMNARTWKRCIYWRMSTQSRKTKRSKTSIRYCGEKLCCAAEKSEGQLFCDQCRTAQCSNCESEIHRSNGKFEFHDRHILEPPPFEELCQSACLLTSVSCIDKNFADLHCQNCQLNYCYDCFDLIHKQGVKKTHRKISFREYKHREFRHISISPVIKPISPLSATDNSLTFVSCPQEQEADDPDNMSFASFTSDQSSPGSIPDICMSAEKDNTAMLKDLQDSLLEDKYEQHSKSRSFMLTDDQEILQVYNTSINIII